MELLEKTQLHLAQSKSINSEFFKLSVIKVQETMLSSDKRDLKANGSLKSQLRKISRFTLTWKKKQIIIGSSRNLLISWWFDTFHLNGFCTIMTCRVDNTHYQVHTSDITHYTFHIFAYSSNNSTFLWHVNNIFSIAFLTNFYIASFQFQAMISKLLLWTVAIFAVSMGHCEALRVLGLFPHPGLSHFHFFHPIMRGLADAGHDVTVVSYFPDPKAPVNYKDLSLGNMDMLTNSVDLKVRMTPDRDGKWRRRKKMCSIA